MITKDHAIKIATKLNASIRPGGNHDIAQFGIRRGSRRDAGHDHIPSSLYISARSALELARCPMSYAQWIGILREKGLIER
jgi:hypothetical protein